MFLSLPYKLILGSASPRRQQLLQEMGLKFSVEVINTDESAWPAELSGSEIAVFLAKKKALAFARSLAQNELLITADTIVWHKGQVYNKPSAQAEAAAMLRQLSNGTHEVFTAVCLRTSLKEHCFHDRTQVTFEALTEAEILFYLEHSRPFDKAGSYGIQDWLGLTKISAMHGSFYTVMGLPTHMLYKELLALSRSNKKPG